MTFQANYPITGHVNFNRYMPAAVAGQLSGMGQAIILPHMNNVGTMDTYTLTPPETVDANKSYKITLNNAEVVFTTDATPTVAELMTGLFNLIRTEPEFFSWTEPTINNSTNVITLTARAVGTVLTLSHDTTGLANPITVAKTVNTGKNAIIPFGRFVGRKATYYRDLSDGTSQATLIDSASGYEILGITLVHQATEQVGIFQDAKDGYPFGYTMNVLKNTGTYKGVWVECVEPDLTIGDSARIAVAAGNEGKLTKSTSNTLNVSTSVTILAATQQAFEKNIVLVKADL